MRGTAEWIGKIFKLGMFWATVVALTEFVGGIFLIFGFLTQIFAFIVAIEFIVIIIKLNWRKGLVGGYEFDLLIFASALALATLGAGGYSIDHFLGLILY